VYLYLWNRENNSEPRASCPYDVIPSELFRIHVISNIVLQTETPENWFSEFLVETKSLSEYLWQDYNFWYAPGKPGEM
jgi:hypothetical protein